MQPIQRVKPTGVTNYLLLRFYISWVFLENDWDIIYDPSNGTNVSSKEEASSHNV